MKKIFIFVAVLAAISMTSCKKSAQDYANELTDLYTQYEKYEAEGNTEEANKIKVKAVEIYSEMAKRAMEDKDFAKELMEVSSELDAMK